MSPLGKCTFRTILEPPPEPPADAAAPGTSLGAQVVPPPADPPSGDKGPGLDPERIAKNALATGGALGVTYAAATALKNAAKASPSLPVPLKVLACALPAASVFASPLVEDRLRQALGTSATHPAEPSFGHYAVASGALFTSGLAMQKALASLPKPSPLSAAGVATTLVQASLASVCAGGATEVDAQLSRQAEARSGKPPAPDVTFDPARKGVGRSLSLVPPALVEAGLLASGRAPLSPPVALGLICSSWSFRGALMPEPARDPGDKPPSATWPPFPPTDIPPA
jgi:hypothetical protein